MKREVKVFSTILVVIIPVIFVALYDVENFFINETFSSFLLSQMNNDDQKRIVTNISSRMDPVETNIEFPTVLKSSHRFQGIIHPENVKKDGWKLIWQDEFEKNQLSSHLWNLEYWPAEKNNELQYYTPDNVAVDDDHLKLVSKRENYQGRKYTSGAVHTKDLFSFQYGKVEMRAKLPSGKGIFPAFWMMPNNDDTWLPEIDILEMVGDKPDEIWMVLHWIDTQGDLTNVSQKNTGPDYSEAFHTYGVEWSPEEITWFIDEEEVFKTTAFVPNMEMYLYLNTAVGGDWPGDPDETTTFPQSFAVDYVRVYEKEG